jgi:5-methylcytosine-specific restriction protein A
MTTHILTTGDIARELHCAPRTAAKIIDSGELPGWRLGNERRVTAEALEKFCLDRGIPLAGTRAWHMDDLGMPIARGLRSGKWPAVEKAHLKMFPTCAACGTRKLNVVHHIRPFHVEPHLELVDTNLLTLCESPAHNCHLIFGHLLCWSSWNVDAVADAAAYLEKLHDRPTLHPPAAHAAAA